MPRLVSRPVPIRSPTPTLSRRRLGFAHAPVKQAVISPLGTRVCMYPSRTRSPAYPASSSWTTCSASTKTKVRGLPAKRVPDKVQTEGARGRLAIKIDPSGELLHSFISLNNLHGAVLGRKTVSGLACTHARVPIATQPTAETSITPISCPASSELTGREFFISPSQAKPTASAS